MSNKIIKIVIVGDSTVGKTSILTRYVRRTFTYSHEPTVFDDIYSNIVDGSTIYKAHLADTSGTEDYDRLRALQCPGTDVFLVCFALNDPVSYKRVADKWYTELQNLRPNVPLILVGTKSDLTAKISQKDKLRLKKNIKAIFYMECSAKQGIGVNELFEAAVIIHDNNLRPKQSRRCILL